MSEFQTSATSPSTESAAAARSSFTTVAVLLTLVGGLLIACSLCGLIGYLILPLRTPRNALETNTLLGSAIASGIIFGGLLTTMGIARMRRRPLPILRLPSPWIFLGLFAIVIIIGQAVLVVSVGTPYLFPPWHVLASGLLSLAVLAYALRRLPPVQTQTVLGQLAWGGLGTVLFALVFELIAGLFIAILAALGLAILIGPEQLSRLVTSILDNPRDATYMLNIISGQPIVFVVAIIVALLFLGMIVPLIEETLKSIGPAALIARQKPRLSAALIWGLAAGAGYAFSENLLNGASGATPGSNPSVMWAVLMLLRGGTSFVHMATTATVSLGWHALLIQRQRRKFFLLLAAALAAHGFWNVSTLVLAAVTSRVTLPGASSDLSLSVTSGFAALVLVFVVVMIFASLMLAAALWIAWLVRWTNKQESLGTP